MIIGTTPTFTLKLKRSQDIDLNNATVYVTLKQGQTTITKSGQQLTIVDGKIVQFTLTEAESLSLVLDKSVEVQLNWTYSDHGVTKRAATKVIKLDLEKQLLKQELTQ